MSNFLVIDDATGTLRADDDIGSPSTWLSHRKGYLQSDFDMSLPLYGSPLGTMTSALQCIAGPDHVAMYFCWRGN